jgi:protease-4
MSDMHDPHPPGYHDPRDVLPVSSAGGQYPPPPPSGGYPPPPSANYPPPAYYPPPSPPPAGPSLVGGFFRWLFRTAFLLSIGLNFLLLMALASMGLGKIDLPLRERHYAGDQYAANKIAVVKLEGPIYEGMLSYVHKQILAAAEDDKVKAVVLRVDSPGGTITASDDLHRRLVELRDGKTPNAKNPKPKPLVVSMGSIAASGGYYVSMPASHLVAERSTITGSIGVIVSLPNVSGFTEKHGISMHVIKSGDVKDSGSMFRELQPQDREVFREMVDHAFSQFKDVVKAGRPKLKDTLDDVVHEAEIPGNDDKEKVPYIRRRTDGGIFNADQALKYGLIDQIGTLEDAIAEAAKLAALGPTHQVITYDRPVQFLGGLLDTRAPDVHLSRLADLAVPKLWLLPSHCELTAVLAALGRE